MRQPRSRTCGDASNSRWARCEWGARRAILQDLGPGATFIAAGLNLPVDADAFDRASKRLLDRFDAEYGWMYETHLSDGRPARIDYTVWSEVMTCPHCGTGVVFFDVAFDEETGRVRDEFNCGSCGATVTKDRLERRFATVRTLAGDTIERVEYRPVRLEWRTGRERGIKELDDADRAVLSRVAALQVMGFPTSALPLDADGSRLAARAQGVHAPSTTSGATERSSLSRPCGRGPARSQTHARAARCGSGSSRGSGASRG